MKEEKIITEDKKVNLRMWMSLKIIPSLLLFAYYWMCVRLDFQPVYTIIQNALIGVMLIFLLILRGKREVFDEFAKETLYKTDSICLKIAYIIMGIILLHSAFLTPNAIMTGYLIAGGIVVLTIIRTIIFCVIDKRGL